MRPWATAVNMRNSFGSRVLLFDHGYNFLLSMKPSVECLIFRPHMKFSQVFICSDDVVRIRRFANVSLKVHRVLHVKNTFFLSKSFYAKSGTGMDRFSDSL